MTFLTLAVSVRAEENGHMHPYVIDKMVEERRQELHRLSRLDTGRPGRWRTKAGRGLAALAVAVGVPAPQRPATRGLIDAALCLDPPR